MLSDYLYEFSVIVNAGGISSAAPRLGLSQSALMRHMAALESALGVTLLDHSSKGPRLTIDGRYVYDVATSIATVGESLTDHFRMGTEGDTNRVLLVGGLCELNTVAMALEDARSCKQRRGSDLTLRYLQPRSASSAVQSLLNRESDIAIVFMESSRALVQRQDLIAKNVFSVQAAVVVEGTHSLAKRASITFEELRYCAFGRLSGKEGNMGAIWDEFWLICEKRGFVPTYHNIGINTIPGFDTRNTDYLLVLTVDDVYDEWFKAQSCAVIPVSDLSFDIVAVTRANDAIAGGLVGCIDNLQESKARG